MPNSRNREGKPDIHRRVEVSRRVQQDYYEDDAQFFYDAQQNQIGGVEALPSAAVKIENIMDEDGSVVGSAAVGDSVTGAGGAIEGAVCGGILAPLVPTPVMRMNDGGVCLSMHQPWAGLLVAGIKVHEGRVWSTDYRGRLWIHAASSQPHDIEEVEKRYAKFSAPHQKFPKHYPTRVLLGYVYLMDCMDRETYERTYTPEQRQEESPFSFICAVGKALPFPLPMSGDHKLFRLNHKVHTAAKKQLMEIS
ncbi:unnamed protein product [Trypanosoma congolense IL3000]|uniref:WGS project CAEQ00000000 data, annotated contig 173 n=1 Tax=Trypanosoma congolense (strain IL3000) TaxID=1068625 RepID=F9W8F2_TRYCI|nr:unnamed protein product [Trypanosoma congolense IL3000]